MAQSRSNKKIASVTMELPECPVCLETMSAPIYNCQTGHSLCATCTMNLCPALCPLCRQPMTQMRNRALEETIAKANVSCPNKSEGCVYTMMVKQVEEHLKECIFREMPCPLGSVFGKCSWNGKSKDLLEHFKERHPSNCNINIESEVELANVSITDDDRHVYLVPHGKLLFMLTIKIDTIQKMAYWILQHIGSKNVARQHLYEVQIVSKQDTRRRATFIDHCFNDAIKADDIFRQGKCCIVPLNMLTHFIQDRKLAFSLSIKRAQANSRQNFEKGKGQEEGGSAPGAGPGPKGPRPRGHSGKGPRGVARGQGPKGARPNSLESSGHRSQSPFSSDEPKEQFRNNHPFNFRK